MTKKMEFFLLVVRLISLCLFKGSWFSVVAHPPFFSCKFNLRTGRTISEDLSSEFCELLLCGSRGIGGVAVVSDEGVISMDLLDLEDDEEEEDDDDRSY